MHGDTEEVISAHKTWPYHVTHTNPFQNDVWHGGVGVDYDGGGLVISYLLQERGRVLAVVKHTHWQSLLGDEESPEELLQVQ